MAKRSISIHRKLAQDQRVKSELEFSLPSFMPLKIPNWIIWSNL